MLQRNTLKWYSHFKRKTWNNLMKISVECEQWQIQDFCKDDMRTLLFPCFILLPFRYHEVVPLRPSAGCEGI